MGALQNNFTGRSLLVRRKASANQTVPYDLMAAAKTKSLQIVNEYGETTTHDDTTPTAIPWRTSLPVSRAWSMNIAGSCDLKRSKMLQDDAMNSALPTGYQLEFVGAKADGGGSLIGLLWIENYQVQSQDMGVVQFTAQLRGEGAPAWQDASA